jgi:hypothetical protein
MLPQGPDQNHPDQPGFGIVEKGQTLGEASGESGVGSRLKSEVRSQKKMENDFIGPIN